MSAFKINSWGDSLSNADHVTWLRGGKDTWNERRRLVKFSPDLSNVNFSEVASLASQPEYNFRGFDFSGADLTFADLKGLDFERAKFTGADLSGANLSESNFFHARFDRAVFHGVVAKQAKFDQASFKDVDLRQSVLEGASFKNALVDSNAMTTLQADIISLTPKRSRVFVREPYKIGTHDRSLDNLSSEPPQKEQTYLVLYATNRKRTSTESDWTFGNLRDNKLNFGAAQVFVPKSHKIGSVGSPFWKRRLIGDDRLKIRKLTPLNGDLHWEMVTENFSAGRDSSPATVLIHGFNTSFESAVLWAAQIGTDLGLRRGISLFSWPSQGAMTAYSVDEGAVEASKHHLAQYLIEYMDNAPEGVNIIAHSMGCRCLAGALEIIGLSNPAKLRNLKHIVFAAADVDQDVMRNVGAHVVGNSGLTTSYVCGNDLPLSTSGWLHDYARVGLLPPVFLLSEVDTVEVGKARLLELGHGYVSSAKEILNDLFQILIHSKAPAERFALEEVAHGSGHWRIKE
ncbi:alpha/beta hydrolase [Parvibaculum sp.]|uniref:alpha/beta hydrolase n=1 Tax=Parvibaculum sp. TaxID=2024848 RepID=UPI002730F742|nr:alpha/beta hydrolase [Parvibaculum sp.]MDP2148746.1 alpha/beta hydrolase [Parvibaculum sp.]